MAQPGSDEEFINRAIELSERAGIVEKNDCFGAVVVKDGLIIGEGSNQVASQKDPTWHAEMHAIKEACKSLGNTSLQGCTLYTSCLPCPMCTAAIYWARVDRVVYAAEVEDISKYELASSPRADASQYVATVFHNREDVLPPEQRTHIPFVNLMRGQAAAVFQRYSQLPDAEKCRR